MSEQTPAHACPLHDFNIATDVPCNDTSACNNRLQTDAAEVRPSRLLAGEDGLFVTRDVEEGEWIASFGPMRRVTAEDTGKILYSIPIR